MPFHPVVVSVDVKDEDETVTLFVRQPTGREMLEMAAKVKKDTPALDTAREIFSKFVVHEDGSAISKEEVADMLAWRFSAMNEASRLVQEKIGIGGREEAKKS